MSGLSWQSWRNTARAVAGVEAPRGEGGRVFQPHLTLARSRAAVDVRALMAELAEYAGTPWMAEEIYLIRSRPDSRPRYETLGSWPLAATTPPAEGRAAPLRT